MTRKKKSAAFGSDGRALWDEVARSVEPPEASKSLGRAKNRAKDQSDDQPRRKGTASPAPEKTISKIEVTPDDFDKMLRGADGRGIPDKALSDKTLPDKTTSDRANPDQAIPDKDRRKIERGQRSIDLKIDLHGLTQEEAYVRLKVALNQAGADDLRRVLIVTGKGGSKSVAKSGKDGRGILARNVPEWLRSGGLSHLISGISTAAPRHGGDGALYVTLRRNRKP